LITCGAREARREGPRGVTGSGSNERATSGNQLGNVILPSTVSHGTIGHFYLAGPLSDVPWLSLFKGKKLADSISNPILNSDSNIITVQLLGQK